MLQIAANMEEIIQKHKEIQKCTQINLKNKLIAELKPICSHTKILIQQEQKSNQNLRAKLRIDTIQFNIKQIQRQTEHKINQNIKKNKIQGMAGQQQQNANEEDEKRKEIIIIISQSIIIQEIQEKNIQISVQQLQKIATRFKQNKQIMEKINLLLRKQGQDLDKIMGQVKKAYQQLNQAQEHLTEAQRLQKRAFRKQLKLVAAGTLGGLGIFFFGIPGLIVGLGSALYIGLRR